MRPKQLFYVLTILLLTAALSSCMENKEPYTVAVIHSYEEGFAQYHDFNKLISKEFRRHNVKVDIHAIYLDCESYMASPELERMDYLLDSIKSFHPDIILVNEDQATYSLLECGNPLADEIPIVFAGVNFVNWNQLKRYPNVTGFRDSLDFVTNFKIIQELSGNQRGYIIADSTFIDMKVRECLANQKKSHPQEKVRFDILKLRTPDAKYSNLLWAISKYYTKGSYLQTKRDFTVNNIASFIPYRCFTTINEGFGYGESLLAGYFSPMEVQVSDQVGAAVKILKGTLPADIPITDSRKEYLMDWEAMQIYKVKLRDVDTDKYKIININFVHRYPFLFYTIIAILSIGVISVAIYSLNLYTKEAKRRKQLLYNLEEERETLVMATSENNTRVWKLIDNQFIFNTSTLSIEEFLSFIHPDDLSIVKKSMLNLFARKKGTCEYRANFFGKYEWWQSRYSFPHPEEDPPVAVGLLISIQSFKDREAELERARDMAEKAELKESFIANMSHEIRTPLNAIVGFSNLLADESGDIDDQEKAQFIHQINDNNELLLNLINDVLELSRIESGSVSFKMQDISISELVGSIYAKHKIMAPGSIQFLYENTLSSDLIIRTDKSRVTQVMTNFINNAFKFTKKGYVKVGVNFDNDSDELELFCEDSGMGIDREHQKIIFTRFYKKDEFAQGTGLGLSICSVIAQKLGGEIKLVSELGKGSRFSLILHP